MFRRLRNLWNLSEIEVKRQPAKKGMVNDAVRIILGKQSAIIIEDDKPDLFPEHEENL